MDEQNQNIRPTKKQRELLGFIEAFIAEHGYSPSYREIMAGCNYTSVATVSLHVNNLIKRGHLVKRDHNARSIEVVNPAGLKNAPQTTSVEQAWLIRKVTEKFAEAEAQDSCGQSVIDQLRVLVGALQVLDVTDTEHFATRLQALQETMASMPETVQEGD